MTYVYIELFLFALLVLGSPLELLLHYWAVMNLARVRDLPGAGLTKTATILGGYILLRGYLLDLIVNVFWMTLLLWELPKELTVTSRINRHTATGSGWRYDRCQVLQTELLKWYDTKHGDGIHR